MRTLLLLLAFIVGFTEQRRVAKQVGEESPADEPPKKPKFEFRGPELNQEEASSTLLPRHMRCDACRGVSWQMGESFKKLLKHGKGHVPTKGTHRGTTRLRESDYLEAIENVCYGWKTKEDHALKDFGVKNIDGRNKLSGPGTEAGNANGVISVPVFRLFLPGERNPSIYRGPLTREALASFIDEVH